MKLYGRSVLVKDGNVEKALRKFKKKIAESGLLIELRARETYEKPTTTRKRRKAAAKNRQRPLFTSEIDFPYSNNSPPQAEAVVPCSSKALMTLAPVRQRCTSSGPSTSLCERMPVYQRASGVSWL